MINYWSKIKVSRKIVGSVDLKRLKTSVIHGGNGISMYNEDPKLREDGKRYNFSVHEHVPGAAM